MKRILFTFLIGLSLLLQSQVFADEKTAAKDTPFAYVVKLDGVISPAAFDLVNRSLIKAAEQKADVVVIEMDTPGGLVDSMKDIIQKIIDSPVPVVTYVSPSGAHAASAGTYILYASHVAAMTPGTNLGAATPIQMGEAPQEKKSGQENAAHPTNTMEQKMVSDAAAYIRSLAELRGRNIEWAEKAVREADSLTASEALSKKVIDVIAEDVPALLEKVHGRTVKIAHGKTQVLRTKNATFEKVEPDWRTRLLEFITHPNVALLLMSIGFYGLVYEFSNPGALFPGMMGVICLLLGFYAMNILPIDDTGLALIFLGLAFMTAEAFTPSFGALGIGGAVAFAVGAAMLIKSDAPGFGVSPWMIAVLTASSVGVLSVCLGLVVKSRKKAVVTGQEEMLSSTVEIINWSGGKGEVMVTGEVWQATAPSIHILQKGDKARIEKIDGLILHIIPLK